VGVRFCFFPKRVGSSTFELSRGRMALMFGLEGTKLLAVG
jgi:hypothetical protein